MAGCPGYILVDVKTKKIILICSLAALLLFVIGILIGFFSGKSQISDDKASFIEKFTAECSKEGYTSEGEEYIQRRLGQYIKDSCTANKRKSCLTYGLPRNYVAYHLGDKTIKIDGKLDDEAWAEVPWSQKFVDMRSERLPSPRLDTKVKVRWDDNKLYVGAWIQETDIWATFTKPESPIYKDNGFEMLMDVDGSMFNYKQMQVNAFGTPWDLMHYKSPYDNGSRSIEWSSGMELKVHVEGTVNNAVDTDKYWTVEWSFTFDALKKHSDRKQANPRDGEVWFMQFGRSEWKLHKTKDNGYVKIANTAAEWWSWNACGTVNLHLQNRWGLVQFRRNMTGTKFVFSQWHIYKSLFDVFEAMKSYKAVNGRYTTILEDLTIQPYIFSNSCIQVPVVKIWFQNKTQCFNVTVISNVLKGKQAHINHERYVWFDK